MRGQVDLVGEVPHPEPPDVVFHERERDDERHEAAAVLLDHLDELGPLVGAELPLEVARARWRAGRE